MSMGVVGGHLKDNNNGVCLQNFRRFLCLYLLRGQGHLAGPLRLRLRELVEPERELPKVHVELDHDYEVQYGKLPAK